MRPWQTISSKVVYESPWIVVHEDQVVTPEGKPGTYSYVDQRGNSVFIVPVDSDGNSYLVQQQRYVTGQTVWEIPAGCSANKETYEEAAKRELLEEAGIRASTIQILNEFYLANSSTSYKGAVCLATDLQKATDNLDQVDGILGVKKLPLQEIKAMILRGEIVDGPTIAAVLTVMAHLDLKK